MIHPTRWAGRPAVLTLTVALMATAAAAADWPQFRGPDRDGVSAEKGLLAAWPAAGPEVAWRGELGEGFSGMAVVGGRLYTMFGKENSEYVVCLDAGTGKELWRHRADDKTLDRFGNGPRSTPTIDGDVLYALSGRGKLYALSAKDGTEIWKRDLAKEFGAEAPTWGVSTSVLVEGDKLLVDVGGKDGASIVAFEKKTGKEVWRSQDDGAGYSAPIAATVNGVRQVIFFTHQTLLALSPDDGSLVWEKRWKTPYGVNASTPIFIEPDRVFVSTGYDVGAALLHLKSRKDGVRVDELWRSRSMKNKFSSSILVGEHVYGFDEKLLRCLDLEDGKPRWLAKGFGHGTLLYADGHLIVLGDAGKLALVKATPEEYQEVSSVQIFDSKTWTMPTLANGMLYLRDEKEIVALKVSGE